jgi:hypothetical protein
MLIRIYNILEFLIISRETLMTGEQGAALANRLTTLPHRRKAQSI